MLYEATKSTALRLLKVPSETPDAPAGSHASVQVFRAAPNFLRVRMILFWIGFSILWIGWWILLIAGPAGGGVGPVVLAVLAFPVLVAAQCLAYFCVRIDYDMRYYIVTDRSIRVREGALVVKEKTITYANVQNMRVTQGPIERMLGIKNLKIDTAGGGGVQGEGGASSSHSVQLAGIENAADVRDLVLGHLKQQGLGTGLGDLDEERIGSAGFSGEALEALRELGRTAAALNRTAQGPEAAG